MPKISIIIPVYKVEAYLPKCIESVLAQTFTDFEVICVNDGSPDNCSKILEKYAQKDKRIRIVDQENQGLSMARNNGLKHANGDYILFLDSDDFIHPQLLEICYTLAEKEKVQMISFNFQRVQIEDSISFSSYQMDNLKYVLTDTPLYYQTKRNKHKISFSAWSKLYKKDLIKDLSFIPGITMEDYPHTYAVLARKPKTVILDIPLYYYTSNPESISATKMTSKKIQDYQIGLNSVITIYEKASQKEKKFILHELLPNILKQQLNGILRLPKEKRQDLYRFFAIELKDLDDKKCISFRSNKLGCWLIYRKLIKKGVI